MRYTCKWLGTHCGILLPFDLLSVKHVGWPGAVPRLVWLQWQLEGACSYISLAAAKLNMWCCSAGVWDKLIV